MSFTHRVVGWRGQDAEQAGHAASDAGQHPLTLLQRPTLKLSRRIRS